MKKSRVHWVARLLGCPAVVWPDRGPWSARLRRWMLHTVWRYDSESCDGCGRPVELAWMADDDLWSSAYSELIGCPCPDGYGTKGGILCPVCFTTAARKLGQRLLWRPTT